MKQLKLEDDNVMNLIDGYILPHYKSDDYTRLIDETIEKYKNLNFIVLTNEQAVVVESKKNYKIVDTN